MKRILFLFGLILVAGLARSQVVYEDISNTGIYDFLDELANNRIIELNSVIKPYSRIYIAGKLKEAEAQLGIRNEELGIGDKKMLSKISNRLIRELRFYLQEFLPEYRILSRGPHPKPLPQGGGEKPYPKPLPQGGVPHPKPLPQEGGAVSGADSTLDYVHKIGYLFRKNRDFAVSLNPLAFQYQDRVFTFAVRPILGVEWMTNENAAEYHRWWGGSMYGYVGKNFGFYASLRDNNESTPLAKPEYLTLRQGNVYKGNPDGGVDYFEMKGGVTVSWKWGSFALLNDRLSWGNNEHGANILSDKAPPFPYIWLHINPVKWFDFNYIHGWLNSGVIDSSRSYTTSGGVYRTVYRPKYIAANMFTFIPWKGLNLSFGNSIIYSDINVHPVYLIPFMFFNAVDASKNNYVDYGGSNSQLFFDVSSRNIKHLHLYVALFIDELKVSRITDPNLVNFTSWKAGFKLSDFPLRNLSFMAEWTKTNPMTYKHYIETTNFTSNGYNLGHYLRDNSMEIYAAVTWKPLRGLLVKGSYTLAQHGTDLPYDNNKNYSVVEVPFMGEKVWQTDEFTLSARYEYISNSYFFLEYAHAEHTGDVRYDPAFLHGKTNNLTVGVNVGF
ncbi:MAG: hypothetical protein WCI71_01860 [Bacteroidota bacterium]